jgi:CHAT domain-containing protein/tetratricopeptide (TPR) repeat protein
MINAARTHALLLVLTFSISSAFAQQSQTQAPILEPGKAIDKTIAADETHSYTLTLESGMYGLLRVDQKGSSLAVEVFSADGQKLRRADLDGPGVPEQLSFVASEKTQYRIEVKIVGHPGKSHDYTITLNDVRPATDQDRAQVDGEQLLEEGMNLLAQRSGQTGRREALAKFQQSVKFFQAAKDQDNEAQGLYLVSYTYVLLAEFPKAQAAAEQGLPIAQATGNRHMEANLLDDLGLSFYYRGDRQKGLDFFQRALALRSKAVPVGLAQTLNNIGMVYAWTGESRKALTHMAQSIAILEDSGQRFREGTTFGNMCVINRDLGQYKEALAQCNQGLKIKQEFKDRGGEAQILKNMGMVYAGLGDYEKALDYFLQSRTVCKSLGDREGDAMATNSAAWVYAQFGEHEKAIEFYTEATQTFREQGNKYGLATTLNNMATSYAGLNDFHKALEMHLQILPLRSEKDDPSGKAVTLGNIASCYEKLGDKQKALEYYTESLSLHRMAENQRQLANGLKTFGAFLRDEGQTSKALDYLNEARTINATFGDRGSEASVLFELARLELDRGNLVEAAKLIEETTAESESVRINLKSQQLRALFLATVRKYYEFQIEVLMRLHQQNPDEGFNAKALQVSEKSRARSILELLREARAEIRQGVDPSFIEREDSLRRLIAEKAEEQTRVLSGKHTEEKARDLAQQLEELTTEYDLLQSRIRQTSPRYADLIEPSPIGVEAIQKQLLDENTLLLEYSLGERKSFVWAVTPDSIKSFELPGRAAIEQEAKRYYQVLSDRNPNPPSETVAKQKQHAETSSSEAVANLTRMLLAPVAGELKQKRLVVVAEGVLQYLPFGALLSPGAEDSRPLIVDHEIVTLPSASVLGVLREDFANRKPASKGVAVFADPVFSANDARLNQQASLTQDKSLWDDAQRSASESGLAELVRLRFSRQEADQIARVANDRHSLKALDFSANRAVAMDARLGDYRVVHFATHALINNQHPDLSGIVLSLVDEQGRPQNGFLRLYDIYNLKLNADLVVLSACQTALGKEIKGEGLVGLTRGFMYAGAPRVVASLWRIDDRATAEIMNRFYSAMLKDGLRPPAALRAAQVSMLKDKRWQSPHFWAAFTLQGEWR